MAIEKRKLPTGEIVGFDTKRNCYCELPKNLTDAPVSQPPLEEMSLDELKELADAKGIRYHFNSGKEKLISLLTEQE